MTQAITVEDLRSIPEYEDVRLDVRRRVIGLKKTRRVTLGDRISFVFENRETMVFQIHEMMRVEGVTDPDLLQAECDVYNSLLPREKELVATMFMEAKAGSDLSQTLRSLAGIEEHIFLVVGGRRVSGRLDGDRDGKGRVAPVQHVRFRLSEEERDCLRDPQSPVFLCIDHPSYRAETALSGRTLQAIIEDLE